MSLHRFIVYTKRDDNYKDIAEKSKSNWINER